MGRQDLMQRILVSFHEAVFDDSQWPATGALIDEACGAKGNFLFLAQGTTQRDFDILLSRYCSQGKRHQDFERLYFKFYWSVDERIPRMQHRPDSQLVHVSSLFTAQEARTSIVYNEVLPLFEARNSLSVRLDGPGGSHIGWGIADPVEPDGWSSSQVRTIKGLLPHLRQFVRARQALVDANALGSSHAALLEDMRVGVIQLARRGRIVAVNDYALDLLRRGDGLADQGGFLHASSAEDDVRLQELLARALPPFGVQRIGGSMVVTRSLLSPRLVLHVTPTNGGRMDLFPRHVAALVLVVDPLNRAPIDPRLVAATLDLTPAESRVAVLLAEGNTIRSIADAVGRSENTVRWHIKRIFEKHRISRQMELVQLVLSLANVPKLRG